MVAMERDATRIAMAKHNAKVYGVAARIDFRCGDCLALLPLLKSEDNGSRKGRGVTGQERRMQATAAAAAAAGDVLFVDPPWGENWNRTRTTLSDLPLLDALIQRVTTAPSTAPATVAGGAATTSATTAVTTAGGTDDVAQLAETPKTNKVKNSPSPRRQFTRLLRPLSKLHGLAKVPPSFDPSTIPGAPRAETWFGHEDGDYRRVKFLLLDLDLAYGL